MIFLSRAEDAEGASAQRHSMQGARTRSVESPWACQVILLARTERAENTETSFDIRAPINAGQCEIQRDAACCVSTTTISNFHFKLQTSCFLLHAGCVSTTTISNFHFKLQTSCFLLHSGACQTSKPCSARILLPMATAALINTRFLMMYCPSSVNTTGKCDQTK